MAYILTTLLLMYGVIGLCKAYYAPEFPGPFCGINNQCCTDRQDECSHPISGTRCYCDEFCKGDDHDDCCPDYEEVCLGFSPASSPPLPPPDTSELPPDTSELPPDTSEFPPPEQLKKACIFGNQNYAPEDTRTTGCNKCTCKVEGDTPFWECEQDKCMIEDYIINLVNNDHLSWRAANYSQFYSKKLKDGLKYKLGTFPLGAQLSRLGAVHYGKHSYPENFDARVTWSGIITPIMDQGWCGSDWAVSLASTISDRFAVQSNGIEKVRLSPQTLLSCNEQRQKGCEGGHIDTAWMFASYHGLVDESCFPYTAQKTTCPFNPYGNLLSDGCTPKLRERIERYKVGPPSRLIREEDIMYDILNSGPVQAVMKVHQDFFHYKEGIYRRSGHGDNTMSGYHTVKVVGWGKDKGDLYWIVANSWGPEWGEDGYFRIARGVNESGIESFMVSVLCYVTEVFGIQ